MMPSFGDAVVLVAASVVQTFGVRVGAEQPKYVVLEKAGPVEIRRYEPRIAAETTVDGDVIDARNEGFRRIAGYIFGGNRARAEIAMTSPVAQAPSSQEIAMTSPVAQTRTSEGWTVQFFMPSRYRVGELPVPNDPAVRLVELPAQTFAVMRFSGSRDAKAVARRRGELIAEVRAQGRATAGEPVAWFYDPPWTVPFLRRNEVAVELAPALTPGPSPARGEGGR